MKKPFKSPKPGNLVEIIIDNKTHTGTLLESHDSRVLLLKLDNGYNIGFKKSDIKEIKLLEKKKKEIIDEIEFKLSGKKPVIDFYLTGGTISSKLDPSTGGVKWLIDSKELFSIYPEIFNIADIRVISPFMKASENMDSSDWIKLAKLVKKSLDDKSVKGVIISHGTDFLHYTAAALSFMIKNPNKPVVLTYSQRSSDRGSSDSRLNLTASAHAALSDINKIMLVGHATSNDDYCYALLGTKVRKMHTSRRDTFRPINTKPLAKIYPNKTIEKISNITSTNKNQKPELKAVFNNYVALVKFYPGQDPKILEHYKKIGYKGLVIEMSGLGHVISEGKNNWITVIKKLTESGMIICAAPQTIYGRLDPYVYSPGRKLENLGVIYLEDMLPETALVKLGWVLAITKDKKKIKELMLKNISGELNYRLGTEFLD